LLAAADAFSAHIVAMVANGFARVRVRDDELFQRLSQLVFSMDATAFSAVGVSQLLHALAVLNMYDEAPELVWRVLSMAQRLPPHLFSAQAVANIGWALAVFDIADDDELNAWYWPLVKRTSRHMQPVHFRQLHQLLLTCTHADCSPNHIDEVVLDGIRADGLKAYTEASAVFTSSLLQQEVARDLRLLGHDVEEEWVHQGTGLSLDIYLPQLNLGIEVDGPSHYARNCHQPLGSTVLKHRLFRNLGLSLCVVPYWEWQVLSLRAKGGGGGQDVARGGGRRGAGCEPRQVGGEEEEGGRAEKRGGLEKHTSNFEERGEGGGLDRKRELSNRQHYLSQLLQSIGK